MTPSEIAKELGKLGGQKNVQKHGKDHMKKISQMGVEAKKRKKQALGKPEPKDPLNMPYTIE